MIRTILFFLSLCIATTAVGQQYKYIFFFNDAFPIARSLYYRLGVVDIRPYKENIGYLRIKDAAHMLPVVPREPIDGLLSTYFAKVLPAEVPENQELIMVLNDLQIHAVNTEQGFGSIYLYADFFCGKNDKYAYLGTIDSLMGVKSADNINVKLVNVAKQYIDDVLAYYAIAMPSESSKKDIFSIEDIVAIHNHEKEIYPIYKNGNFKTGIYRNVDDFINGQPLDTPIIKGHVLRDRHKSYTFYFPDGRGKKGEKIDESFYFAIYDGEHWFLSEPSGAELMEYTNKDFFATILRQGPADVESVNNVTLKIVNDQLVYEHGIGDYRARFDPATKKFRPIARIN